MGSQSLVIFEINLWHTCISPWIALVVGVQNTVRYRWRSTTTYATVVLIQTYEKSAIFYATKDESEEHSAQSQEAREIICKKILKIGKKTKKLIKIEKWKLYKRHNAAAGRVFVALSATKMHLRSGLHPELRWGSSKSDSWWTGGSNYCFVCIKCGVLIWMLQLHSQV